MSEYKEALFAVCQLAKRPAPHFENVFNGDSVLVEVIVIPHQPVRGAGHNLLAAEESYSELADAEAARLSETFGHQKWWPPDRRT